MCYVCYDAKMIFEQHMCNLHECLLYLHFIEFLSKRIMQFYKMQYKFHHVWYVEFITICLNICMYI